MNNNERCATCGPFVQRVIVLCHLWSFCPTGYRLVLFIVGILSCAMCGPFVQRIIVLCHLWSFRPTGCRVAPFVAVFHLRLSNDLSYCVACGHFVSSNRRFASQVVALQQFWSVAACATIVYNLCSFRQTVCRVAPLVVVLHLVLPYEEIHILGHANR